MSDSQETIADLIAWLRRPREGENAYLTLWRDEIADRLDAAHRRERGDAAKLREAAVTVYNALEKLRPFSLLLSDVGHKREFSHLVCLAKNRLDAALAAPPRNCDKYANHNDAMKAFDAFVREQGKLGFINLYTESFKWLFAPSTEKKGGDK